MAFFFCSLSRTSGNCGENNDCLPASSVSHGLHITNSLSATKSLIKEAVGLPFKADSIYTASHQWPSGSSVSNEQLVFKCLTQGLWQITISFCFCCTWITDFLTNSHFILVLLARFANTSLKIWGDWDKNKNSLLKLLKPQMNNMKLKRKHTSNPLLWPYKSHIRSLK